MSHKCVIQYLSFCDSLILLRIMPLSFIHVVLQLTEIKDLFPHFILGFMVSNLKFTFNSFCVAVCVWCKVWVYFHSFVCECTLSQYHFLKKTTLSPFLFLTHLSKVNWGYTYGFTSESFSVSFGLYVCCYNTSPFCLDY